MSTIVLDPGHGGDANLPGSSPNNAVGPSGTREKDLTLDVARRTCDRLLGAGHRVLMTRSTDVNVSAADRVRVAREARAEVFLSIHFNGFRDPAVQGSETLVRPAGGAGIDGVDAPSLALARDVQAELVATLGTRDRGLVPGRFAVLSEALHDPSTARCLAEVSFLTDPTEESRLADTTYRDRIAGALAQAVGHHLSVRFGSARPSPTWVQPRHHGRTAMRGPHDPDGYYGDPRSRAFDAPLDDDTEGGEYDVGEPISIIQSGGQTDAHCPTKEAATAGSAHFALSEFRCRDGTECPERFRGHLQDLMDNLEVLRTELGDRAININSGYRTPSYNESIGGATRSKHMCGMAADFTVSGVDLDTVFDTIERLIAEGRMRQGGLSRYRTFVHYDVRGTRSRWSGG